MKSSLTRRRVTVNQHELTIRRPTGRHLVVITLPKRFLNSGEVCGFSIDVGMPLFVRAENDAVPIRRPNRKTLGSRVERKASRKLSSDIVDPDISIVWSASPKRVGELRTI